MYIPKSMTKAIANAFYDKSIDVLSNRVVIDAEGGVTNKGLATVSSFKGNVSFSNCEKIQEEYGLDYEIDIAITTDISNNIEVNSFIKYDNIIYNVTDVKPCDSHILIVATKSTMPKKGGSI